MGKTKGLYRIEFAVGTWVRVANQTELEQFIVDWKWHHPLESTQLRFAGQRAQIESGAFYHGGDELYQLKGIPGTWHEECLQADTEQIVGPERG